jgi:uncharacterized protein YgiM (DUF1202 family)
LQAEPETETIATPKSQQTRPAESSIAQKFGPFTGKITKNKVRIRLQPNYEGPILRELNRDDLIVVVGETDDFYAIQPPDDFRGYVFRTYVLDNTVEGDRVNVRIKPDKDATILSQLKAGEHVEGAVSATNNKWLEIKLPNKTRFYIAKDFVEKAGDAGFKSHLDKKRKAAYDLLKTTDEMSKTEAGKPFEQMNISGIKANYQHIIKDYPEFPDAIAKAKESSNAIEHAYNAKKLLHLEELSRLSSNTMETNRQLNAELETHKQRIGQLQQEIDQSRQFPTVAYPADSYHAENQRPIQLPVNMTAWLPVEENLFNEWSRQTNKNNPQDFYGEQMQQNYVMTGIIDPYNRPVKNKPGDYVLLNPTSKLPIAFLYSTMINLQDYVGHEVSIRVSPRSNNNFAFPAYFVLSVD